LKMTLSEC